MVGTLCFAWGAVFVWLAFHHHERAANGTEYTSLTITILQLVIAAPGLILGVRELRAGLWLDREVVIVRGPFRTWRLSPDEVDGFKPGDRLYPVLHRQHGPPVGVVALARGSFWRQAADRQVLEAQCDRLNALLRSVQSQQPTRSPAELGIRPSDHRAEYARRRLLSIAITLVVLIVCVVVALLLQTVAAVALVTFIAVAQLAGTYIGLRQARRELPGEGHGARATNPP